jgi:hypothetical protein
MECPYCHSPSSPETPCMEHPPVPMSYWPNRSEPVGSAAAPAEPSPSVPAMGLTE